MRPLATPQRRNRRGFLALRGPSSNSCIAAVDLGDGLRFRPGTKSRELRIKCTMPVWDLQTHLQKVLHTPFMALL